MEVKAKNIRSSFYQITYRVSVIQHNY